MGIASGTKIGRYEIRSKIGAGGMGEVFLATDSKLDRQIALKILPNDVANDAERMRRFVQEAKSASALNHPNIITIYEIGETDETHFIATEYIEGETLHKRLKNAPASLKSLLDMAIQIAGALQAAHKAGIVHRNVKPENVMIRPDGLVKILDFGIAKLTEKKADSIDEEAATAIKAGTSPIYSIEQPFHNKRACN
jgi:serine/threonine protein kinase